MSVNRTLAAIRAMPHVTVKRTDGEWRVAPTIEALAEIYPNRSRDWRRKKQERQAHYTTDDDDARLTAAAISGWCVLQMLKGPLE